MKCSVFIAMSLDGFIAREDGSIDWLMKANQLVSPDEDGGYKHFISDVDAIVMGRHAYEKVLSFDPWPYSLPVLVLSHQFIKVPESLRSKVQCISESPSVLIDRLSKAGMNHLYIDGGLTIQTFLNEDCIDELTITVVPVLIGQGKRLFGELKEDIELQLLESRNIGECFVQLRYKVKKHD